MVAKSVAAVVMISGAVIKFDMMSPLGRRQYGEERQEGDHEDKHRDQQEEQHRARKELKRVLLENGAEPRSGRSFNNEPMSSTIDWLRPEVLAASVLV